MKRIMETSVVVESNIKTHLDLFLPYTWGYYNNVDIVD